MARNWTVSNFSLKQLISFSAFVHEIKGSKCSRLQTARVVHHNEKLTDTIYTSEKTHSLDLGVKRSPPNILQDS